MNRFRGWQALAAAFVAAVALAVARPEVVADIASRFGSQCVVASVDARRSGDHWEVFTHGGRRPTGINAVDHAVRLAKLGAGEILLTSMDRDGTKSGFDLELTRAVADAVPVPVIASGGVGNLDHLADGVQTGGADAVLAASIFHYGEYTVAQAKADGTVTKAERKRLHHMQDHASARIHRQKHDAQTRPGTAPATPAASSTACRPGSR